MNELAAIQILRTNAAFLVLPLLAIVQERRLLTSALVDCGARRQGNTPQFDVTRSVSPSATTYLPAIAYGRSR
jgi:hypothetical protein